MQATTYIDYQRFSDGSHRWLWQIMHGDRLWRGGLAHTYPDARLAAHSSWEHLRATLPEEEAAKLVQVADLEVFDLRRLASAGQPDIVPPA